jgi:transcriptional regulator with XRE-family HTH domain
MKTKSEGKSRGTFALLDNVAPNLFCHRENQSYWGVKKMNGKRTVHALDTADNAALASGNIGTRVSGLRNNRKGMGSLPFCQATLRGVRCRWGPYATEKKGYPSSPKTLGEEIRKRRLDLNLRQIDVSKIIGCDEMTVVNWEKGYASPRINHMPMVVEFLGFNPLQKCDALAQQIVRHRTARGLTQKEFARKLGVDPTTLARWERGERAPTGMYLSRVTETLQSIDYLCRCGNR